MEIILWHWKSVSEEKAEKKRVLQKISVDSDVAIGIVKENSPLNKITRI